jgi:hypothetical protein
MMREPHEDADRFDEAFRHVRNELKSVKSVLPQVTERIDSAAQKPAPRFVAWSLAASLLILVPCVLLGWRFFHASPGPSQEIATSNMEQVLTLRVDDAELIEHIAAIMDHRFVVVIWTYRGQGVTTTPVNTDTIRTGKYQLRTLYEGKLADGRTFVCSLCRADEGVKLILEPPSIYAQSGDNSIISCSVSPRLASTDELARAIRSAGMDGKSEISVEEILRKIREQILQ